MSCQAICSDHAETARSLYLYKDEFHLWCSMANFEEQTSMTRHQYWYDANSNCWYVRHQDCTKFMKSTGRNQDRPVCDKCLTVGDSHSIVRSAQRFAVKHLAAELLSLRLFGGAEAGKEVMEKAQGLQVYKTN